MQKNSKMIHLDLFFPNKQVCNVPVSYFTINCIAASFAWQSLYGIQPVLLKAESYFHGMGVLYPSSQVSWVSISSHVWQNPSPSRALLRSPVRHLEMHWELLQCRLSHAGRPWRHEVVIKNKKVFLFYHSQIKVCYEHQFLIRLMTLGNVCAVKRTYLWALDHKLSCAE